MANIQDRIAEEGKKLFALKAKKTKIEDQLKEVNKEIVQLSTVTLAKLMGDAEVEKITIKGKGTLYMSDELYASVLKDDRPTLYAWLRKEKCGDIIQDYVFPQTLTAFAKERLLAGKALPDVLKAEYIPTAKTRSGGAKK